MNRDLTPADRALAASIAQAHPLETAHGIKRTGPAKVSGKHLSDAANEPELRPFLVRIKSGDSVVMDFGVMGRDRWTVAQQHQCLCAPGQHVQAVERDVRGYELPIALAENELAQAELREAQHTDDWHRRNDARARALDQQHFDVLRMTGVL